MKTPQFWIVNRHTMKCYGPYKTAREAKNDIEHDSHKEDWALVQEVADEGWRP